MSTEATYDECAYWRAREAAHRAKAESSTSEWARKSWLALAEGCAKYAMRGKPRDDRHKDQAGAPDTYPPAQLQAGAALPAAPDPALAGPCLPPAKASSDAARRFLGTRPRLRIVSNDGTSPAGTRAGYWRNVAADFHAQASQCRLHEIRAVWDNLATLCEDLANASLKAMRLDITRDESAARWRQRMNAYQVIARRERSADNRGAWTALAQRCAQIADHLDSAGHAAIAQGCVPASPALERCPPPHGHDEVMPRAAMPRGNAGRATW